MKAMYIKDGQEVQSPDPRAGLYVKTGEGSVVKLVLEDGDLLFIFGQAAQVQQPSACRSQSYFYHPGHDFRRERKRMLKQGSIQIY